MRKPRSGNFRMVLPGIGFAATMPCMSQNPRRGPSLPPSQQTPSSRANTGRVFVVALFLLVGLLVTVVFGRLLLEGRLALGPTPTLTRPPASTGTPTVDIRATIVVADMATQAAYQMAQVSHITPIGQATLTPTATPISPEDIQPTDTPDPALPIYVPVIGGSDPPTDTPEPTRPVYVPVVGGSNPPTETPPPDSETPTPTDTPVPTVTPTPTPLPVSTQQAITQAAIDLYAGPSVLYPIVSRLTTGLTVLLAGRTASGEWVHVCCMDNIDGWARQKYFKPFDNPVPTGAPANTDGNDQRWLAVQESNANPLEPLPTQTAIPDGDFPLFRHDAAGTGQVNFNLPSPPAIESSGSAGGGISASPVIVGSHVLVPSLDNHLYNFIGNGQHWRIRFDTLIQNPPAIQTPYIYVIEDSGLLTALKSATAGESAVESRGLIQDWQIQLPAPSAALNIRGNTLFAAGSNHTLYALERLNSGSTRWTFSSELFGPRLQYPAIGDQLIYVGDAKLSALDVYSGTLIWQDPIIRNVTGPPVYAGPLGSPTEEVYRLAEVYVAEENGTINALDANTGVAYWREPTGYQPTSLAVDDTRIYAAGPSIVLALDRRTGVRLWSYPISSNGILGGLLVGNNRVLVTDASGIYLLDGITGTRQWSFSRSMTLQPVVSNGLIYLAERENVYSIKIGN